MQGRSRRALRGGLALSIGARCANRGLGAGRGSGAGAVSSAARRASRGEGLGVGERAGATRAVGLTVPGELGFTAPSRAEPLL